MSSDTVVLVVDDERDHADGIAEALDKLYTKRAKTIAVYSGKDALEILRSASKQSMLLLPI
jgi:CheY-like chemotaxis protein